MNQGINKDTNFLEWHKERARLWGKYVAHCGRKNKRLRSKYEEQRAIADKKDDKHFKQDLSMYKKLPWYKKLFNKKPERRYYASLFPLWPNYEYESQQGFENWLLKSKNLK